MPKRRRVTIADVAARVGLTSITVSRALNRPELVKPETRSRIEAAASELGYVPNAFARGLKHSESRLIGFVTASVDNPFYAEMIKAVSRHAKRHNYAILLFDTDGEPWLEAKAIETLLSYQAAGIILSPVSDEPHYRPAYVERLRNSDVAVVQLDRTLADAGFSAVVLDNAWAGECAARHLLQRVFAETDAVFERRATDLLVVAGPERSRITQERLAGVRKALARRTSTTALSLDIVWGDYTLAPARERVSEHIESRGMPGAIFGLNQLITLGALQAMKAHGIAPDTLSVVSVDRLPYLDIFDIHVPCVVHDGFHAGQRALEMLLERIAEPELAPQTETVRGVLIE
ncbi:LacI family DNA-binding transcriptional regulator [Salinisphaera sp. Q1T1-3]|uniref:LacI family DNA-binding transcriptional regulator n=1 Tax=Salinisphaera sp. Q1T1-3 TaxID=2321229 RepID=UPI000E75DB89|nr:LacI family DNA-binding transcriptional regulator [Salinisphaera sp. Q1T1-3]RJS94137.1 LacI family transcriptional regulator [Salinisphaera sp. Q1T1-3]